MMIRAGVDDRAMLACSGRERAARFRRHLRHRRRPGGIRRSHRRTALSFSPGDDTYYLLASLVVVIVGGMGSVSGVAVGALLVGWATRSASPTAEPTGWSTPSSSWSYVLAFRPQASWGGRHECHDRERTGRCRLVMAGAPAARPGRALPRRLSPHRHAVLDRADRRAVALLGVIALSLMFLAGLWRHGVALADDSGRRRAYMIALIGASNKTDISLGWPWGGRAFRPRSSSRTAAAR